MSDTPEKMSTKDVMRVAVEADCDERTVRSLLAGGVLKPRTLERVRKALETLGLERYAPSTAAPVASK